jgi:glycosyltransferase involved in cell wall biosynthesis
LDIDDWEIGFINDSYRKSNLANRLKSIGYSVIFSYEIGSYWNRFFCEKLTPFADEITVSNSFLQRKFGGTIVWHGRDANIFNPRKFDKESLKEKYSLNKPKKIVTFFGTPRPYKGIQNLIRAISLIRDPNILLLFGGAGEDKYSQKLAILGKQLLGKKFLVIGPQPFEKIPEFLAISDVVVIPQENTLSTIGQIPAKIFDAMAMAKPIISTDVSDIPDILEGCGWIVKPGNAQELAEAISHVINNSKKAEKIGWNARRKFLEKYSLDVMAKKLLPLLKKYE